MGSKSKGGGPQYRLVNCGIKARKGSEFWSHVFDQIPVVGYRVHKNDVEIVRKARNPEELTERLEGSTRGVITELSAESRKRLGFVASNGIPELRSFITLTYPREFPGDGKTVKRHLKSLLQSLRRRHPGLHYLWFLEFQARGAPHFHAFTDVELPEPLVTMRRNVRKRDAQVNSDFQNWISRRWFEVVDSGDERHLAAGSCWEKVRESDGAARYVAKEAWKTFQKQVPERFQNVGRFWGTSRGFMPPPPPMIHGGPSKIRDLLGDKSTGKDGNLYSLVFNAAKDVRDTGKPAKG